MDSTQQLTLTLRSEHTQLPHRQSHLLEWILVFFEVNTAGMRLQTHIAGCTACATSITT